MYDIIIVGGGPAGMSAAIYALRANKTVLVLEAKAIGGQILNANVVENYPAIKSTTGYEFASNLSEQVTSLGAKIIFETVLKIDEDKKVYTKDNTYQGKAVIIATGAYNKELGIDKEEEFIGKGVSYCASCDGNFYKDKIVAVVGGGNTALEDALYLSSLCKKVYIIVRKNVLKAEKKLASDANNKKNIEIIYNTNVSAIHGSNKLTSVDLKNNDGKETNMELDGLFIAVGQAPRNEVFNNVVDLDEYGYILSDDGVHTKTSGIYVAGDTRKKDLRQLVTAVSDGAMAATTAIKELKDTE